MNKQPLDYAPIFAARDAARHARKERIKNIVMYVCTSLLMWTVLFFTMAGVYLWRVEGIEQAWMFLGVAVGSLGLLLGAWCASPRFRKMWRNEV